MDDNRLPEGAEEERRIADLIREGGARQRPSTLMRETVRTAVRREWQNVVALRTRRRRLRWSLAAAATLVAVAAGVLMPRLQSPPVELAAITRLNGAVEVSAGGLFSHFAAARSGGTLTPNSEIRSGPGGRVALQVGSADVRVDENTVLTMAAADRISLQRGAIYVDSMPFSRSSAQPSRLRVETPFGTVEHLGTQYETRVLDGALRVRVREGRVSVVGKDKAIDGAAGEQVTVLPDGAVRRRAVARDSGEWAWVGEIAPTFDIDNRPLTDFLQWVGRETGRNVTFASPATEAEAASVVLRGSIAGMTPERALEAVLSTTRLASSKRPDRLVIDFSTGDR